MGTSGSAPDVTREDARSVFSQRDGGCEPLTTAEIADRLDCAERTAKRNLRALVELGELDTREVGPGISVWWRTEDDDEGDETRSWLEEYGAFVRAVEDYAIFMLDPDGTVVSRNEGAERIKGYSESEIVGEHFSTFYTDDDAAEGVPQRNLDAAAVEGRVEDEGWRVRADGTRFWADVVITAIRDDDGELRGYTKVTRDMTEQRDFEQQLQRERDLTGQIFETVPLSIAVVDSDGEFVRANERALDAIGIDAAGLSDHDIGLWDLYDADGEPIPVDERPWRRAAETDTPVVGFQCQVDLPDVGRRWLSINAAPLEDEQFDDRIVVTADDVTDRKERERQLRREQAQTEKLLRTAPVGIAVQNADRETVIANRRAQETFGLSEREFREDPVDEGEWEICDPEGEPLSPDETPSARVLEREAPVFDEEIVVKQPDGERLYFRVNAAPLFDADGEIERVITAGEDVTELKERERRLERRTDALENELRSTLDRVSDAFYALDGGWRFTHVNDRAVDIMGRPETELLGERIWDVFPDAREGVYRENFEAAMDTQESVTFEVYSADVDSWLEFNVYPSESGLSIYFRDVTERKERERDLERTERRFEAIFEDPNILVGLLEPDGTVLDINETAMEYIDADLADVTGDPFWETPWWGTGEDVRADVREWTERAAAGEYVDFEADLTTPEGERYTLNGVFRPVTDDDGNVVSVIVSDRDVTERREYERELEESERRYRALVDNFPNGAVALVDDRMRYQTVGGTPTDGADVTADQLEGRRVAEILTSPLADEIVPRYEAALDGTASSFELELADGFYQYQIVPVRDADGEPFAALGMSQDVTERKERERELTKYETIVETVNDGIYVKDDEGHFTMVNVAYAEMTGYDRDALLGRHTSLVVGEGGMQASSGPDAETGGGSVEDSTVEATLRTANGSEIPAEGTFATFRTGDGEPHHVGVVRDVTERREQQRKIEESERRYRTLVENFPNGAVGLFDDELRYTAVGGQLLDDLGVSPDDRVGDSLYDVHPAGLIAEIEPHFHTTLDGEANEFEIEYRGRHLSARTLPVRNGDGEVFAGMVVVQDVTEQVERERRLEELVEKLEESNERLEQFAYAASHDLQEPLRMVSSYLQLIEGRYADELDEDGREFIEFAVDGADRMRNMIEGLLDYSRVDTRGDPFEPVDLNDVFDDVRDDLQVSIEETGAEITADELPTVDGDAGQLRQVFQNLLDNAIEYSGDETPRVTVSAERNGARWLVSVSDEGIGIDPGDADRVFEVFQSLHGPGEHDGTGIGLALCERIVERHGGDIWVESEPGDGATFTFSLPPASESDA